MAIHPLYLNGELDSSNGKLIQVQFIYIQLMIKGIKMVNVSINVSSLR